MTETRKWKYSLHHENIKDENGQHRILSASRERLPLLIFGLSYDERKRNFKYKIWATKLKKAPIWVVNRFVGGYQLRKKDFFQIKDAKTEEEALEKVMLQHTKCFIRENKE